MEPDDDSGLHNKALDLLLPSLYDIFDRPTPVLRESLIEVLRATLSLLPLSIRDAGGKTFIDSVVQALNERLSQQEDASPAIFINAYLPHALPGHNDVALIQMLRNLVSGDGIKCTFQIPKLNPAIRSDKRLLGKYYSLGKKFFSGIPVTRHDAFCAWIGLFIFESSWSDLPVAIKDSSTSTFFPTIAEAYGDDGFNSLCPTEVGDDLHPWKEDLQLRLRSSISAYALQDFELDDELSERCGVEVLSLSEDWKNAVYGGFEGFSDIVLLKYQNSRLVGI